ncbi:hypothetical protein BDN70DRAFT_877450 [Pholiota conissans]|uniref:Uncharacterized protein n=1 Tax=Pholiota conissans TaxID=109636 RepID=A0A9P6D1X5_9AGAR|nr:hypothetical protein BDN70DRAFT_877450 [Pholiota conissans]
MPSKITTMGSGFERRPTLPSIHSLDLPLLTRATLPNVQYVTQLNACPVHIPSNRMYHDRNVSTSSSNTNISRSPSPASPQDGSASPSTPTPKFRLVPCEMENADAVILVPPPGADADVHGTTSSSSLAVQQQGKNKGILIVGSAWHTLCRNPKRPLAKGARIHPYRIVRGDDKSRRNSVISVTAVPVLSIPRRGST